MNYFYKIAFVAIGFITIRKLFSELNNGDEITEDSNEQNHSNKEIEISEEFIIETHSSNKKANVSDENTDVSIKPSKNKWLYPDDDFGEMKTGRNWAIQPTLLFENKLASKYSSKRILW